MERVNGLCRVLAICALMLLIGVGQLKMLPKSEAAKQAEEVLQQQIYEIQTALNEDNKEKILLFETGCFSKDYSQEQLNQMISKWVTKASKGRTHSKEALSEVKKEIASLYKKQKEIASDPLYKKVSDCIYMGSAVILIICNLNIILVHRRKCQNRKENDIIYHNDSQELSKTENIDNEINENESK